MSMSLVARCWGLKLDKTRMITIMALCDSADDDGSNCYPSPERVRWKAGISRATYYRVIADFEQRGALAPEGTGGSGHGYTIHLEAFEQKAPLARPHRGRPKKVSHGEKKVSHGEKKVSHGEKKALPERSPRTPAAPLFMTAKRRTDSAIYPAIYPTVAGFSAGGDGEVTPPDVWHLDGNDKAQRDWWAASPRGVAYLMAGAHYWDRLSESSRWYHYREWIHECEEYIPVVQ